MRSDMARVIVERPRRLPRAAQKGRARALDDLPHHEGMRRPYARGYRTKELTDNLRPLRRYLERQVGRPWNKIYSEIARGHSLHSTMQRHLRLHLQDFVALTPRRRMDWGYRRDGSWGAMERLWPEPLYVDPRDGILKRTDRLPEAKAQEARAKSARRAAAGQVKTKPH